MSGRDVGSDFADVSETVKMGVASSEWETDERQVLPPL
jgi:hypothetical protein